jgi:hypothetical protein
MMKKLNLKAAALIAAGAIGVAGVAVAHHSFAMFDQSKHVLVVGKVTAWNYNNPHSWLMVEAPDETGKMQTWSFEGAAPVHATRQGVTGDTFKKGDEVRVVMSPIKDGRRAGGICFAVKTDGTVAQPYDGTCKMPAVYEKWKAAGWLDGGKNLETHPGVD